MTLIDKNDAFVFGYSKLDLLFRDAAPEAVRLPYAEFVKPGVRLLRETVTAIDPEAKRVTTDVGEHEADLPGDRARRRLRPRGDAGAGQGRERVLLRRRGRSAGAEDPRILLRAGA